jgi:hypothetical protein
MIDRPPGIPAFRIRHTRFIGNQQPSPRFVGVDQGTRNKLIGELRNLPLQDLFLGIGRFLNPDQFIVLQDVNSACQGTRESCWVAVLIIGNMMPGQPPRGCRAKPYIPAPQRANRIDRAQGHRSRTGSASAQGLPAGLFRQEWSSLIAARLLFQGLYGLKEVT